MSVGEESTHRELRRAVTGWLVFWCGRRDLNPHAIGMTQDFKSWVSADSTTPASKTVAAKSNTRVPEGQAAGEKIFALCNDLSPAKQAVAYHALWPTAFSIAG